MKAIQDIYQQYAPAIYRFALGLSGDSAWADDLTAETFVRAFVSTKPIRQETVKAYLFTITRNLYFQQLRHHKRIVPLEQEFRSDNPEPEQIIQKQEHMQTVLTALQQLSATDRTILLMRGQDELSYADIALTMGLSLAAVKVKLFRARRKLQQLLKEVHDED